MIILLMTNTLFYSAFLNVTWNVPQEQEEGPLIVCGSVVDSDIIVSSPACIIFMVLNDKTQVCIYNVLTHTKYRSLVCVHR